MTTKNHISSFLANILPEISNREEIINKSKFLSECLELNSLENTKTFLKSKIYGDLEQFADSIRIYMRYFYDNKIQYKSVNLYTVKNYFLLGYPLNDNIKLLFRNVLNNSLESYIINCVSNEINIKKLQEEWEMYKSITIDSDYSDLLRKFYTAMVEYDRLLLHKVVWKMIECCNDNYNEELSNILIKHMGSHKNYERFKENYKKYEILRNTNHEASIHIEHHKNEQKYYENEINNINDMLDKLN